MYSRALRLRPRVCTLSPVHAPPAAFLRVSSLRSYQTSKSQKQLAAEASHLDVTTADKPRPFAIERVGGRECHVSWTDRGISKEWREISNTVGEDEQAGSTSASFTGRFTSWLRQMFLPTNFPQSVHRSYLPFHGLQFFETIFGTVVSVLCNQAMLTSVGVSAEGSIFGAVAVQWIIKDGAGEVAKLFFIRRFSPYFDSHPKTCTLFGESIVALGSALQIGTILVNPSPTNFLLCAAGGNAMKLIGYAVWFTTHMKWVRYFSLQGNMGDVAAKDEAQTSLAQLVGYAAGIGLLTFSHSPAYLYGLYSLCTPAHLVATVAMMRLATFETLTVPRLTVLAREYATPNGKQVVPSYKELEDARETGVFGEYFKSKKDRYVALAPRVADVVGRDAEPEASRWDICTNTFWNEKYMLYPSASSPSQPTSVFYHPDATSDDTLRSVLHAARLQHLMAGSPTPNAEALREALAESYAWTTEQFDGFKTALEEKGWRTDEVGFADHGHRLLWGAEADRGT
ncbi:vitamin B6 photo-protection and homoeostasis-domain-containing protein [Rhodofomes roseus]|uniref:Vitamin B6 photo-protection and homoeostasis-domain-containing protein n=1 Tax=Rhodofomes roseus TaxID=34475 RepID=A0ABQ8K588_9APHY|nr:vitamin B6 photo-protection and homoeostasis-domain-containing protein [Rhodofomes roseus]KAH9831583.1 vitamin B6 photo-protection and homoeostasis-domain-containing protein [Rhodofomes roseus]